MVLARLHGHRLAAPAISVTKGLVLYWRAYAAGSDTRAASGKTDCRRRGHGHDGDEERH